MLSESCFQEKPSQNFSENSKPIGIKSNNVILEDFDQPVEAIILIQDGKIFEVICVKNADPELLASINKEWDVKDYENFYVFPGLIDSNVHLHADFDSEWENIQYCTELAATGGVTTIIDNPVMCKPYFVGREYVKSLQQRISTIKEKSKVDFGIFGILEPLTENYVKQILEIGALGLKCYMMSTFQSSIGHYPPERFKLLIEDLELNYPNLLLLIHSEVATERELYLTSPCRSVPLETRLDDNHVIASLDVNGGANKGSYVDDFSKKNSDNEENNEEDFTIDKLASPSDLKGRIKKVKGKMDTKDIVFSELASYFFENHENHENHLSDDSNSDGEVEFQNKSMRRSCTFPAESRESFANPSIAQSNEVEATLGSKVQKEDKEDNDYIPPRRSSTYHLPSVKKSYFSSLENRRENKIKIFAIEEPQENEKQENEPKKEARIKDESSEEDNGDIFDKIEPKKEESNLNQLKENNFKNLEGKIHEKNKEEICFLNKDLEMLDQEPYSNPEEVNKEQKALTISDSDFRSDQLNNKTCGEHELSIGYRGKSLSLKIQREPMDLKMRRLLTDGPDFGINREANNDKEDLSFSFDSSNDLELQCLSKSLLMSPTTPASSSLLQRRISKKVSQLSMTSSPTNDFKRINTLQIVNTPKSSTSSETKQNQNYRLFLANRPQSWEENAVSIVLSVIQPETKIQFMFQNLSLASSLLKIRQKKKLNKTISDKIISDTCPSYLFFSEKVIDGRDTKFKVSPPFRNRENKNLLIETLRLGGVDTVSSYHFFVPAQYKSVDDNNFRRAFGGLNSIGCSLQATWTALYRYQQKNNKRFMEDVSYQKTILNQIFRQIYKSMCFNPAQVLKISERKGAIEKGRDADFVIWDPFSIDSNNHLGPLHVFQKKQVYGMILKTYLRGNLIYDRENMNPSFKKEYSSNFIKPSCNMVCDYIYPNPHEFNMEPKSIL